MATCRSCAAELLRRAARRAPPRPRRDRRSPPSTPSTRRASAASSATRPAAWSGSWRRRTPTTRSARSTRSTRACTPSTPPGSARRSRELRPSETTGELYLTHLVAAARADGRIVAARRGRGRRPPAGHQRPRAARPGRVGHAGRAQRALDAGRRDDARPVDGLPRPRRRAGRGRRPGARTSSCAAGRRSARARPSPAARRSTIRAIGAGCRIWASVIERSEVRDGATVGPFSHLRPNSIVGRRRRDRQLRRDQEQHPRRRA